MVSEEAYWAVLNARSFPKLGAVELPSTLDGERCARELLLAEGSSGIHTVRIRCEAVCVRR